MARFWLTHLSPSGRTAWQLFSNGRRVAHFFYEPEGNITIIAFIGSSLTIEEVLPSRKAEPGLSRGQGRQLLTALENRQLVVQTRALTIFARDRHGFTITPDILRHLLEKVNRGFAHATTITLPYLLHWDKPIDNGRCPWDESKFKGSPVGKAFVRTADAARWVSADRDQIDVWVRERWANSGGLADGQQLLTEALQKKRLAQLTLGPAGQLATKLAEAIG